MQGVYAIVNAASCRRYVGSARDIHGRYAAHLTMLRNNRHHCAHLQRAWNRHGAAAFSLEVLEDVADVADLKLREQFHMDATPEGTLYNSAPRADRGPGMEGKRHTDETKAVIREKRALQTLSQAQLEALRGAHAGHRHSEESRLKMSMSARLRKVHGHKGCGHSSETKDRIRVKADMRRREALLAVWEMCT